MILHSFFFTVLGSFATVFVGTYKEQEYAIKILKHNDDVTDIVAFTDFRHEVSLMSKLKHNNLVSLKAISMKDPPAFALDYMPYGNFFTLLETTPLNYTLKLRLALDIGILFHF